MLKPLSDEDKESIEIIKEMTMRGFLAGLLLGIGLTSIVVAFSLLR